MFEGDGYVNDTLCPIAWEERCEREDCWMKILRTKCPYGFNDRTKDEDINETIDI